jgi:hypothetical protein
MLVAALDCPSAPGSQRLHTLFGREVTPDGQEVLVVLTHRKQARTLAAGEPFFLVKPEDAADFDLAGWKAITRRSMEEAAAEAERARLRTELETELRDRLVVPERIPPGDPGTTAKRRDILEELGRAGFARPVGKSVKPTGTRNQPVATASMRVWLLARKSGDFVPEPVGSRVLLAGMPNVPDGIHRLLGFLGGQPVILGRRTLPPEAVLVTEGMWKRPGSEDPARWVQMAREQLRRDSQPDPEDVRVAMLDRLTAEHALTPTSDGERVVLEVLRAEGYAARLDDTYVLSSSVPA